MRLLAPPSHVKGGCSSGRGRGDLSVAHSDTEKSDYRGGGGGGSGHAYDDANLATGVGARVVNHHGRGRSRSCIRDDRIKKNNCWDDSYERDALLSFKCRKLDEGILAFKSLKVLSLASNQVGFFFANQR